MPHKDNALWPGWETVGVIGRGRFGSVYEIQRSIFGDVEKAALKIISIPQNTSDIDEMQNDGYDEESITSTFKNHLKSIVSEYTLMRKLTDCINIVNCDDIRYIQHNDGIGWDIFIKMELLTPMAKVLPISVSDETVIKLAKDMCTALIACNRYDIVHRDIKPQNIFVSSHGDYKLGDFGIAKTVEKTMGGTKIGTYKYMAPEVYNNQPYGSAADIYSLGLVLYWVLNEHRIPFLPLPPQKLTSDMEEAARIRRLSGEQLPPPVHGSTALKRIVLKACSYNPQDRFSSAAEMLKELNTINRKTSDKFEEEERKKREEEERKKREEEERKKREEEERKQKNKKMIIIAVCSVIMLLVAIFAGMFVARVVGSKTSSRSSIPETPSVASPHTHTWRVATCTSPQTCSYCGEIKGKALGHQWIDATYDSPKTCALCGHTVGTALEDMSKRKTPASGMIAAGNYHSVHLYPDGTVFAIGSKSYKDKGDRINVSSWTNIVSISASSHTVGLKDDGTVVACGMNGYGQCDLSDWTDIIAISTGDNHTVGLKSDGTVVAKGKNKNGQCDVSDWRNIVAIAASENETYGLKDDGTIVSVGRYTYGSAWKDVVSISGGTYDLFGLKKDGTVVAAGNNSNWSKNTVSSWDDIIQISVSSTHVVGLKSDGTVVACGRGEAYEACNVDNWEDIVQVSAGMYFTIGLKSDGTVVAIGENSDGQCNIS